MLKKWPGLRRKTQVGSTCVYYIRSCAPLRNPSWRAFIGIPRDQSGELISSTYATHTAPRIQHHAYTSTSTSAQPARASIARVSPTFRSYAHPSVRTDTRLSARRLARRVHVSSLSLRTDTRLSARRLARRVHVSSLSLSHPPPSLSLSRKPTPVTAPDGRPSPRPGGMVGRTYVYVLVSCRRLSP